MEDEYDDLDEYDDIDEWQHCARCGSDLNMYDDDYEMYRGMVYCDNCALDRGLR